MPDRKLVLVAGTGRSGTSTLVGVLQRHGFHVPLPEVAADDTNPRGFGEPQWVVELHGRLLRKAGVQVADSRPVAWAMAGDGARDADVRARVRHWLAEHFEVSDRLVVKDPRSLWFLPLWTEAARELGATPSFVTMLRPPPETVGSRRTYYNRGLEDPHGIASWLNLMTGTEQATRGHPRAFVRYHDLLDDWSPALARLWQRCGLGDVPPTPSEDPGQFIDPSLRRMRMTWADLDLPERLAALATEADGCLDALATAEAADGEDGESVDVLARLDAVRASYAAYYRECESVAHSSVVAARPSPRATPPPRRQRPPVEPPPSPGALASLAASVPPSVRRHVPASLKRRVRRAIDGG